MTSVAIWHCRLFDSTQFPSRWAYSDTTWANLAALAPIVVRSCNEGDAAAMAIIAEAAAELLGSVRAVVAKGGFAGKFKLVLAGKSQTWQN